MPAPAAPAAASRSTESEPTDLPTEQPNPDDVTQVSIEEIRAAAAELGDLPTPTRNPKFLPISDLEPEVFERLAAEMVTLQRSPSVHFYGRRGQRQYGLDIVEEQADGTRVLYQVKRYSSAEDFDLRATVATYAGPPRGRDHDGPVRRFNPRRFVILLSAPFDNDTANVDTLTSLQDEYRGDLQLAVWGAERISQELRGAAELVYAMFGEAWVREWCGDTAVAEARKEAQRRRRIGNTMTTAMNVQFDRDNTIRFRQIDLTGVSVDSLFVDVPVTAEPGTAAEHLLEEINPPQSADGQLPVLAGAAQALLHPDWSGSAVIVGGPGQGKTTLLQYLCQHHRARLLDRDAYSPIAAGLEPVTTVARTAIRIELTAYAEWRRDKLAELAANEGSAQGTAARRSHTAGPRAVRTVAAAGIVPYIAHVVAQASREPFTADDFAVIASNRPMLIALDGLDEVADPDERADITAEINQTESLLRTKAQDIHLLVATRPGVVSDPIWRNAQFAALYLAPLTNPLRMKYLDRWTTQSKLDSNEISELRKTFTENITVPHVAELAGNPMQLAILLRLMQRRAVLPERRTVLYDRYIDVFMDRESKSPLVAEHKDIIVKFHKLLAWHIHTHVELGRSKGSIGLDELRTLLVNFLARRGLDAKVVDDLFDSVTGRVLCLVERELGSREFQFEVQPLREYFAAQHAYDMLPNLVVRRNTRPACLGVLLRRPYWSNVMRFFAGRFTSGEVPSIIFELRDIQDERHTGCHPLSRVAAKFLLDDHVMAGELEQTVAEMVRLVLRGPGQVFALDGLIQQPDTPLRFVELGGRQVATDVVIECLATDLTPPDSAVNLLRQWGTVRAAAKVWLDRIDSMPSSRWLDVAVPLQALSNLTDQQRERIAAILEAVPTEQTLLDVLVESRTDLVSDVLVTRCLDEMRLGIATAVPRGDDSCHYGRLAHVSDAQRFYDYRRITQTADKTTHDAGTSPPPRPRARRVQLPCESAAWRSHVETLTTAQAGRADWRAPSSWHNLLDNVETWWSGDSWPLREAVLAMPDFAVPVGVDHASIIDGSPWRAVAAWLQQATDNRREVEWWQNATPEYHGTRPLAALSFLVAALAVASTNVVAQMGDALNRLADDMDRRQWAAATQALHRYAQNVATHRKLNLADAMRTRQFLPNARLAVAMWHISQTTTQSRLVRVVTADLTQLWNAGPSVRTAVQEVVALADQPFTVDQLRGARADLPITVLAPSAVKSINQRVAEQVLAAPHDWPTAVVRRASDCLAARLDKQPPVALVAEQRDWNV